MLYKRKKTSRERTYRGYIRCLFLFPAVFAAAWACVGGSSLNRAASRGVVRASVMEAVSEERQTSRTESLRQVSSRLRIIECGLLERKPIYQLEEADYQVLLKIVEAEAGGEDENGKLLVANVVLNRVNSDAFPDTVTEVVYQKNGGVCQFSPVSDGRINRVSVSRETEEAVKRAIYGEDISQGALYFVARQAVPTERMKWFDSHLTRLFAYGGHEFFG